MCCQQSWLNGSLDIWSIGRVALGSPKASPKLPGAFKSLPKSRQRLVKVFPKSPQSYRWVTAGSPRVPRAKKGQRCSLGAHLCNTFRHFVPKVAFSCGTSALSSLTFCRCPTPKRYFWDKVSECGAKLSSRAPTIHFSVGLVFGTFSIRSLVAFEQKWGGTSVFNC